MLALAPAPAAWAADLPVLIVGVQPSMNDIWAGVAANAFEKNGVKLEFQTFTSGPAMFAALQGGAIHMGIGGMTTFYVARANGQKISWIATTANLNQSDACMVGPNSTVKSPKDLAGKKIGFVQNSVVNGPLLEVLEANNIPKSSVQLLNLAPPAATAALLAGDLDVAVPVGAVHVPDRAARRQAADADAGHAVGRLGLLRLRDQHRVGRERIPTASPAS
jgi:ABC-type nitrate/sulfonate/bicarbonate transport system substrate-binding protein